MQFVGNSWLGAVIVVLLPPEVVVIVGVCDLVTRTAAPPVAGGEERVEPKL